jgi:PAS domain S-box-containing protein
MATESRRRKPTDGKLLQLLVDGIVDCAIYLIGADGRVMTWNSGAERLKGYSAEEIIGQPYALFFTPEDRAAGKPDQALRGAREHGRFTDEGWRVRKDGGRFWASALLDAIHDESGKFVGYGKVTRDLTERLAAREALLEAEQQFGVLIQGVVDYAIFMLGPDGYVKTWNPGAERIKGYKPAEILGRHFSQFYTDSDKFRGEPQRALHTASTEGRYEKEGWRVRKDGGRFWASVIIDRITDPEGRIVGFAKVTRDLTERKKAQEEMDRARAALAQAQKMEAIGQLTGGVAHDFNNLLTVITNSLDLLATPGIDDRQRTRVIESAQRAADRAAKLTQQLLAFARRQPLKPKRQDVNVLLRGFEAILRRAAGDTVEIELELAPERLVTEIDGPQFESALLNLVVNARDAMSKGGRVIVRTQAIMADGASTGQPELKTGPYVVTTVEDNGEGMPPDVLTRAFDPFFSTKEPGKGTGLGLSQVYGFVTQSGGHIELTSVPSAGTKVTIYLPRVEPSDLSESEAGAVLDRAFVRPGTILVVDDDPDVLTIAVTTLQSLGYEVMTAPDGPTALAVLRRGDPIDVLFSDVMMPKGMSGVELAREARNINPEIGILLASGYPVSVLSAQGLSGDFALLPKPYRWAELAQRLREIM